MYTILKLYEPRKPLVLALWLKKSIYIFKKIWLKNVDITINYNLLVDVIVQYRYNTVVCLITLNELIK